MREKENPFVPLSSTPGCQAQCVNQVLKSELLRSHLVEALPRGMEKKMGLEWVTGSPNSLPRSLAAENESE